jgi:uncharacterized NAD-dependent epimerase/dehydratase family protein
MNTNDGEIGLSSYPLPIQVGRRRMAIFAEDCFSPLGAKTAVCLIRYVPDEIVAVIDSTQAPSTVQDKLGFGGAVPIISSVAEAVALGADVFVLGTAPRGGLPTAVEIDAVAEALESGLHVMHGMHRFLGDDPELSALAEANEALIWDVRRPPALLAVSSGEPRSDCRVVMTVGSDCNTGKMTVGMELVLALRAEGIRAGFASSGQTGMMITGRGIPIDAVVADFLGGATEALVAGTAPGNDVVILEGQGSILHPGYAGVTIGMIAGALPHGLILCHQPTRKVIRNYQVAIPPLSELVNLYRSAVGGIYEPPVIGIALNTFDMCEDAARTAVETAERETGLPSTDPIRVGSDALVDGILRINR